VIPFTTELGSFGLSFAATLTKVGAAYTGVALAAAKANMIIKNIIFVFKNLAIMFFISPPFIGTTVLQKLILSLDGLM